MYDQHEPLIDAVEINYELMMSPITVLQGALRPEILQQLFAQLSSGMEIKVGPKFPSSEIFEFDVRHHPRCIFIWLSDPP